VPERALEGLRVIEVAALVSAPLCSRLLADYGADVVKVEPPGGDPLRALDGDWFAGLNTNKRSLVADLETAEGRAILAALLEDADVLVCDRMGDDAVPVEEVLDGAGAKLVKTWITPFGRTGPHAEWLGGDLVTAAAGGLTHITGDADREPLVPGGHQVLHLSGLAAFSATLIAVWHARRTGEGQEVDVSMQEVAGIALECVVTPQQMADRVRTRMGTHHPAVHGVGMQHLADGRWLFVGTLPQLRMWQTVVELMGEPEWSLDEKWHDPRLRRVHADEIDALAATTFAAMATADIYPQMKAGRVPVGLVRQIEDLLAADSQLVAREFFPPPPSEGDARVYPGAPWRMSATPWELRSPAPELGSTTFEQPTMEEQR
jgi:crotonobetainyl-CoA:carnitine CoA-transferase CaiB-like acyl-CoA transferase